MVPGLPGPATPASPIPEREPTLNLQLPPHEEVNSRSQTLGAGEPQERQLLSRACLHPQCRRGLAHFPPRLYMELAAWAWTTAGHQANSGSRESWPSWWGVGVAGETGGSGGEVGAEVPAVCQELPRGLALNTFGHLLSLPP